MTTADPAAGIERLNALITPDLRKLVDGMNRAAVRRPEDPHARALAASVRRGNGAPLLRKLAGLLAGLGRQGQVVVDDVHDGHLHRGRLWLVSGDPDHA